MKMDPATATMIVYAIMTGWNIITNKGKRARIFLNAEVQRQTQEIDKLLAEILDSSSLPKPQAGQYLIQLIERMTLSCAVEVSFRNGKNGFWSGSRLRGTLKVLERSLLLTDQFKRERLLASKPAPFTWEDERFNDIIESILPSHWFPVPDDGQDVCYRCHNVMRWPEECPLDRPYGFCMPRIRFLPHKDQRTESWSKNNQYIDKFYYPVGYSGPLFRNDKELQAFGRSLNNVFTRTNFTDTNFCLSEYAMLFRHTSSKSKENRLMKKLHRSILDWRGYQKTGNDKSANAENGKIYGIKSLIKTEEAYRYYNEFLHCSFAFSDDDLRRAKATSAFSNPDSLRHNLRFRRFRQKTLLGGTEEPGYPYPLTGYDLTELRESLKQELKEPGVDNKWVREILGGDELDDYYFTQHLHTLYLLMRTMRFPRLEYEAMNNAEAGVKFATEQLSITAEQKRELEDRIRVCYILLNKNWKDANEENHRVLHLSKDESIFPFVYRGIKGKIPKKSSWSDGLELNTPRKVLRDSLLGAVGKRVASYKVLEVNHAMKQSIDELQDQCQFLQRYLNINFEHSNKGENNNAQFKF